MKAKIAIIIIFALTILPSSVFAQQASPTKSAGNSPTPSPKTTAAPTNSQIEKIKDLVASKVAELKLVEKKGVIGTVKTSSNTQISVINHNGEEIEVDIDELTKFEDGNDDDFGISDIEKDDMLSIIGLYNKDTKRLLARFISIAANIPDTISGVITDIDEEEFTLSITTLAGEKKTVDVSTSTKTVDFLEGEIVKSGFSKLETNARVVIVGFSDPKNTDQINASRVINLADISSPPSMEKFIGKTEESPEANEEE